MDPETGSIKWIFMAFFMISNPWKTREIKQWKWHEKHLKRLWICHEYIHKIFMGFHFIFTKYFKFRPLAFFLCYQTKLSSSWLESGSPCSNSCSVPSESSTRGFILNSTSLRWNLEDMTYTYVQTVLWHHVNLSLIYDSWHHENHWQVKLHFAI